MIDNTKLFGEAVRSLREKKELLLRQVAAALEVDTSFLSKMERNEKKASRQQVCKLEGILEAKQNELLTLWLSDQLLDILSEEKEAYNVLKLTEQRLKQTK